MIHTDEKIRFIVNSLAHDLLAVEHSGLNAMPNFGSTSREGVSVVWWQYRLDTCTHFVYISSRRFLMVFQKKFLSGFVVESDATRRPMSDAELGEYD
jgi:hypothetical protein